MEAEQLIELANIFKENRDYITNEESAKLSLVLPFIKALGYDPKKPKEVRSEYSAEFTQGDGKKFADKMDFAIFDASGLKPLIVIETKSPNTDLRAKCQQLARYISQMQGLHFGIMTDGISYQFYGDLNETNRMDEEPFFMFSINDPKTDWVKVASFLSKFSRDSFNAETLITDAENSRYKQAMTDKLIKILSNPTDDDSFMKWLTTDIYTGKKTSGVMNRMNELAKDAIEPALRYVVNNIFAEWFKPVGQMEKGSSETVVKDISEKEKNTKVDQNNEKEDESRGIVTTEDELKIFEIVKEICIKAGYDENKLIYKDTINYFNVSYDKPTKWFIRFFGDSKRKNIITQIPTKEVIELAPGLDIEDAPPVFGISRIYISDVDQLRELEKIILRGIGMLVNG